jgi:alcohol dehydrogenase
VLGHEGIGIVESVGSDVKNFKAGDRVILTCATACGACRECKRGLHALCSDGGWILGHKIDGTQAEYVRVPHADGSLQRMVNGASDNVQCLMSDILITGHEMGTLVCSHLSCHPDQRLTNKC